MGNPRHSAYSSRPCDARPEPLHAGLSGNLLLEHRTYNIGLVDVASGGERPLLSQDWGSGSLLLRPYLTSDRWALLSDMSWESGRGGTLRVLDLQTGKVLDRIVNPEP